MSLHTLQACAWSNFPQSGALHREARILHILHVQEHEQSVDPNLLVLADAYDTAMAKLDGATADVWTDVPARGEAATDSDTEQAPHARHKDDQPSSSGNPSGMSRTLHHCHSELNFQSCTRCSGVSWGNNQVFRVFFSSTQGSQYHDYVLSAQRVMCG